MGRRKQNKISAEQEISPNATMTNSPKPAVTPQGQRNGRRFAVAARTVKERGNVPVQPSPAAFVSRKPKRYIKKSDVNNNQGFTPFYTPPPPYAQSTHQLGRSEPPNKRRRTLSPGRSIPAFQGRNETSLMQGFNPFYTPPPPYALSSHLLGRSEPPNKRLRTFSPDRSIPASQGRNENSLLQMAAILWEGYRINKQTGEDKEHKYALRNQLHEILKLEYPYCGLFIVGSTVNGMGTRNCDMDLCLMLTQSEVDQKKEAIDILKRVSKLFSKYDFIKRRLLIKAKVPILKFMDAIRGIEVDLNVNNAAGIRNTQLLNSYSRIDIRVSPLVVFIKQWARHFDINDAKTSTLSSYTLALMVIHYLQYACNPPVIPCLQKLQEEKFNPDSDISKLKLQEELPPFVSRNCQSIGELLIGFLDYYANTFDYGLNVISVRTGSLLSRPYVVDMSSEENKNQWKWLCVEEPFDTVNVARSVHNENRFCYILQVFKRSWEMLNVTKNIDSIMPISELLATYI